MVGYLLISDIEYNKKLLFQNATHRTRFKTNQIKVIETENKKCT